MSEAPRILQIFNSYIETGGEEKSVHRVCESLRQSYEVRQCMFDSREWKGPSSPSMFSQAWRMFYNPESIQKVRALHEEHKASTWLLHNVFPVGSAGIYKAAHKLDVPVIQYIHNFRPFSVNGYLWSNGHIESSGLRKNFWPEIYAGSWQNSKVKTAWYAAILKYLHMTGAFERVNAWVAISEFMRQTFIEAGIPAERVFHIPHSWEIQHPRVNVINDEGYYVYLGRLSDMKGISFLLSVWVKLEDYLGSSTPKLIIGGEGPLKGKIQELASQSDYIEYVGIVIGAEKAKLLQNCRAMIAPSLWWEPLGLVTYEAYEYQKPMLAAASGGLIETVQHEKTGFLHSPGNVDDLLEQIQFLQKNPEQSETMGRKGRSWLESQTHKSKWLTKFHEVFRVLENQI